MSVSEHDSISQVERALGFIPDTNDPTAGRIAISREMASEQVRLIADPAPLGLGAFALTTFLLSLANAGVMPAEAEPIVFGVALAYGGIAQILAGMWEFRKSNVFGATVFTSYGAFWLSFWAYVTFYAPEVPTELRGTAAGWFLISWGIFTTLMLVAALRTTAVRMSRSSWNFGGGPMIVRRRSRCHCGRRCHHSRPRHAVRGRRAGSSGGDAR